MSVQLHLVRGNPRANGPRIGLGDRVQTRSDPQLVCTLANPRATEVDDGALGRRRCVRATGASVGTPARRSLPWSGSLDDGNDG